MRKVRGASPFGSVSSLQGHLRTALQERAQVRADCARQERLHIWGYLCDAVLARHLVQLQHRRS